MFSVILDLSLFLWRWEKDVFIISSTQREHPQYWRCKKLSVCVYFGCVRGWQGLHNVLGATFTSSSQPVPWRALLSGLIARSAHRDQPCQPGRRGQSGSMAFWEVRFSLVGLFPLCHLRGGGWRACHCYCSITLSVWRSHTESLQEKKARAKERGGRGDRDERN